MSLEWAEAISEAIDYIEKNITEDITIEDISGHVFISPYYFQKGFSMLCGITVSEYTIHSGESRSILTLFADKIRKHQW